MHDQRHNESQISVARPAGAIDTVELYSKAGNVQWLCHTLHAVLGEHHLKALCPPQPKMSERELEVLKWSAAGKTAADVACILSLSQSTVNFHIRSVITKTNAPTRPAPSPSPPCVAGSELETCDLGQSPVESPGKARGEPQRAVSYPSQTPCPC